MTSEPLVMNVSHETGMKFNAVNSEHQSIPVEPCPCLGGSGENPNPIDYLLAALGSCTGIKVLLDLTERGTRPDSLKVSITGNRLELPPTVFENLHLTFHLGGELNETVVTDAIHQTMTLHCPVAVMMGKATTVTWEHRIEPR